jgi:NADH-quinone oxidoreductase subunit J
MTQVLFFVFSIVAIAAAVMMIVHRNPVYCALFLILSMFSLAGIFVLLNAPFIAAVHIIVYAGAIMVLFLFVIMLLDLRGDGAKERSGVSMQAIGILAAAVVFVELVLFFKDSEILDKTAGNVVGHTEDVGKLLFTEYLFPFEIASLLLLSAIIGSVVLAKLKLR